MLVFASIFMLAIACVYLGIVDVFCVAGLCFNLGDILIGLECGFGWTCSLHVIGIIHVMGFLYSFTGFNILNLAFILFVNC